MLTHPLIIHGQKCIHNRHYPLLRSLQRYYNYTGTGHTSSSELFASSPPLSVSRQPSFEMPLSPTFVHVIAGHRTRASISYLYHDTEEKKGSTWMSWKEKIFEGVVFVEASHKARSPEIVGTRFLDTLPAPSLWLLKIYTQTYSNIFSSFDRLAPSFGNRCCLEHIIWSMALLTTSVTSSSMYLYRCAFVARMKKKIFIH